MSYEKKTVDDVERRLRDAPDNLKVLTLHDGLCYPIHEIRSRYVKPTKDWTGGKCYIEVDEDEKGATQVMIIE